MRRPALLLPALGLPALVLALASAPSGCGGSDAPATPTDDVGVVDGADDTSGADTLGDAGPGDTAPADTASADAGPGDAGPDTAVGDGDAADAAPFDIVGTASGDCGAIKGFLTTTESVLVEIPLLFDATDKYERARLSPGGQKVYDAPNAGGSSKESEVMTFELLHHCDGAVLLKTETEVKYGPAADGMPASITDMIVSIGGVKIAANPKRVFKPLPLTMTDTEVRDQLIKDFTSINGSNARVLPEDKWVKQILHVWVPSVTYYDAVKRVLPTIDAALRSNTIVLLTRTTGGGFIYCDPDPPMGSECPPIK